MADNAAATGGVIKDHSGCWVGCCALNLGSCGVLDAELWDILKGLEFCWAKGWRKINLNSDSLLAIRMISKCHPPLNSHKALVIALCGWLCKD